MKKVFAIMLCGLLLVASVPSQILAADKPTAVTGSIIAPRDPSSGTVDPTTNGLQDAIIAVKEKITIPDEYSQFNYYFNDSSSYADAYWSFTWSNPTDNSSIQVNCDANYHITYFNKYDATNKSAGISKYLKNELELTAEQFIYQIAPELRGRLDFINATYEGVYSGNYTYNFQRINNGIDLPDNKVTVSVNSISGEVTSATINWLYDVSVPSSKVTVTKEKAEELIKNSMQMKLVYRSNYIGIYDRFGNLDTKAYLVYEPTLNYISVDAKTGEVYLDRSQYVTVNNYNSASEDAIAQKADGSTGSVTLTEDEIKKIEELKNLITKEQAFNIVTSNKSLYLEDTLKAYTASLNKVDKGNGKTSYVWNISLNDPRPVDSKETDYYRAYANATVDAQTGKILSFYSSIKSHYDQVNNKWETVNIKYNKEQGRAILEKFLKSQIRNHFDNSVLVSSNDDYVAYYDKQNVPTYGGYSYQYNRTNEGVEYPYNNISGSVDGVSGKIYSYGCNWNDNVVFESTEGAMSADKAMDYYLGNAGFGLKYEINTINKYDASYAKNDGYYDYSKAYSVEYKIRLVYRPDVNPSSISPFTGEQLDWNGEVYKVTQPYSYSDITDTPENRNILLLADMNIGFEGDKFLPDQDITVGEMNKLLSAVGYGYYSTTTDTDVLNAPLTREQLAQNFIYSMGLEKVSKLAGIYKTGYNDENSIDADFYGAVALAKGYGLMTGDDQNNFRPKDNITRFEAVDLIMNFINVQKENVYN